MLEKPIPVHLFKLSLSNSSKRYFINKLSIISLCLKILLFLVIPMAFILSFKSQVAPSVTNADNLLIENTNNTESNYTLDMESYIQNKTPVRLSVGKSEMINIIDKQKIYQFISTNPSIADVDPNGKISGLSNGDCTINVYSYDEPSVQSSIDVHIFETPEPENAASPTYIDGILIVNKDYALPKDYNPGFNDEARAAFDKMSADAYLNDLNLYISSSFRSYDDQAFIYKNYIETYGQTDSDKFSAMPGHSEHQSGLAIDLNTIDDSFRFTEEYNWLEKNCYKYGFIIRYPEDKESITGYQYEPWHIRYVGEQAAKEMHNNGQCLEEYLNLT